MDEPESKVAQRPATLTAMDRDGGARGTKSPVVKRSIVVAGHKTSVSLEDAFWKGLKEIARARRTTLSELVAAIDLERQHGNLSSTIRLVVLDFYRNTPSGNKAAAKGAPPTAS
jgi:predicted DNA-binding ribbon-helix-helix protein